MDPIKARKYPEVWPFIPEATNVPIDEDKIYAFFDAGMILDGVYDSKLNFDQNLERFKRKLIEDYGYEDMNFTDLSINPEELGWRTVIMTGRQFVDQLYKIDPDNDDYIISIGRWSNMTAEEADRINNSYLDKLFGVNQE